MICSNRRNDLWSFAVASPTPSWQRIDSQSIIPPARSFHSLSTVGTRYLLLFGGLNIVSTALRDYHLFDVENSNWIQPTIEAATSAAAAPTTLAPASTATDVEGVPARGFHSCTVIASPSTALFFGGSAGSQDNTQYFNDLVSLPLGPYTQSYSIL